MTMATEVADQSIDGDDQTRIRDLRHQFGEETDLDHQSQREKDHGHQSQGEIDHDHPFREETDRPRQFEDEIALTGHQDGDQRPQNCAKSTGQTKDVITSELGEETLHQSTQDPQRQSHDGDRPIDVLLTLQAKVVGITGTTGRMDGMMIGGMEGVMRKEMTGDPRQALRKSLQKIRRQSVSASWQQCNKTRPDLMSTGRSVWQHWLSKRKQIARLKTEHVRSHRNTPIKVLSSVEYARKLTIRDWLIVSAVADKAFKKRM